MAKNINIYFQNMFLALKKRYEVFIFLGTF